MKVAQINKPGGDFQSVERDIPEPGKGQVRVKVEACGVCHSDIFVKEGLWPGSAKHTLEFSALSDVHPMIEKFPFGRVADAYERMYSGKVRFRAVLMMES